jgi:hypothetical protein
MTGAWVRRGLEIASVPLDLEGKNVRLVGLGSYLENAVAGCNDCHSAGPSVEYAPGGNPYFKGNSPKVINQSVYLGGRRNLGSLVPSQGIRIGGNNLADVCGSRRSL